MDIKTVGVVLSALQFFNTIVIVDLRNRISRLEDRHIDRRGAHRV